MRKFAIPSLFFAVAMLLAACGGNSQNNQNTSNTNSASTSTTDTPTDAYKRLYAAVKAKNTDAIKNEMTKGTQDFAISASQMQKKPIEQVFENGFTATTFSPSLPEIRDQRIAGNMGAIEVWNSKESTWEDLPYILENGKWKLAIGELFAGTYKSPGKGRAALEREASNSMANAPGGMNPTVNSNTAAKANTNVKYDGPQVEPLKKAK